MQQTPYKDGTLDLSKKGLVKLCDDLPNAEGLQRLYLEGNDLRELPNFLFTKCRNLTWLDLRNNKLEELPTAICQLRGLRTLLLEGNMLTRLPRELGDLTSLSAINLSRNPLRSPPPSVIAGGTKAILEYLRGFPSTDNPANGKTYSVSDTDHSYRGPCPLGETSIANKTFCTTTETDCVDRLPVHRQDSSAHQQGPIHNKKALLHKQPERPPRKEPGPVGVVAGSGLPPPRRKKKQLAPLNEPPASIKEQIATEIQRAKDRQCLEDWKEEAKRLQRLQHATVTASNEPLKYTSAAEAAPYATQTSNHTAPATGESDTPQRIEPSERAKQIAVRLEAQRVMLGIRQPPSKELIDAEIRLAEVLQQREELEARKKREYRLTAFTGDLQ